MELHDLLPEATEINLVYFKEHGYWTMWAARESLVEKLNGEVRLERTIFAKESGATPLEAINKHINGSK